MMIGSIGGVASGGCIWDISVLKSYKRTATPDRFLKIMRCSKRYKKIIFMNYADQITQILNSNSNAAKQLQELFQYYKSEAAIRLNNPKTRLAAVKAFQVLVDDSLSKIPLPMKSQIKCRKGCAFCCHIRVFVSLCEAEYILAFCEENNISIDFEYIKKQAKLKDADDYLFNKLNKCVFLGEDNTCTIYEARPLVCRTYLVVSDPKDCDINNGKKKIAHINTLEENIMVAGLMAADECKGSLPEMLLKAKGVK